MLLELKGKHRAILPDVAYLSRGGRRAHTHTFAAIAASPGLVAINWAA